MSFNSECPPSRLDLARFYRLSRRGCCGAVPRQQTNNRPSPASVLEIFPSLCMVSFRRQDSDDDDDDDNKKKNGAYLFHALGTAGLLVLTLFLLGGSCSGGAGMVSTARAKVEAEVEAIRRRTGRGRRRRKTPFKRWWRGCWRRCGLSIVHLSSPGCVLEGSLHIRGKHQQRQKTTIGEKRAMCFSPCLETKQTTATQAAPEA